MYTHKKILISSDSDFRQVILQLYLISAYTCNLTVLLLKFSHHSDYPGENPGVHITQHTGTLCFYLLEGS